MIVLLALIAGVVLGTLLLRAFKPAPVSPAPVSPARVSRDEAEARALLGVDAAADVNAIRAAHRRLVNAVHPDRGGSADLTRRINAARDILLKR